MIQRLFLKNKPIVLVSGRRLLVFRLTAIGRLVIVNLFVFGMIHTTQTIVFVVLFGLFVIVETNFN